MNSLIRKSITLVLLSILLINCKEEEPAIKIDTDPGTFKFTLDGTVIISSTVDGWLAPYTTENGNRQFSLWANYVNNEIPGQLGIKVYNPKKGTFRFPGNKQFADNEDNNTCSLLTNDNFGFFSTYLPEQIAGSVTITSLDMNRRVVSGYFEARLRNVVTETETATITKGYFNQIPF